MQIPRFYLKIDNITHLPLLVNPHQHWMTTSHASNFKLNETFARSCIMMSTIVFENFDSLVFVHFVTSHLIFRTKSSALKNLAEKKKMKEDNNLSVRLSMPLWNVYSNLAESTRFDLSLPLTNKPWVFRISWSHSNRWMTGGRRKFPLALEATTFYVFHTN